MPTEPRLNGSGVNSAGMFGRSEPPVPVPVGSPVWAMKPVDHPVEDDAVVKAALRQGLDLGDVLRARGPGAGGW